MKIERDKFLTEAMGNCWHDEYDHEEPTFQMYRWMKGVYDED